MNMLRILTVCLACAMGLQGVEPTRVVFASVQMTGALNNRKVTVSPLVGPSVNGTNLVYSGPITLVSTNGVAPAALLYPGGYRVMWEGLNGFVDLVVPETNVTVYAADCAVVVPTALTLTQYYTREQVQSNFLGLAAWLAGSNTLAAMAGNGGFDTNLLALFLTRVDAPTVAAGSNVVVVTNGDVYTVHAGGTNLALRTDYAGLTNGFLIGVGAGTNVVLVTNNGVVTVNGTGSGGGSGVTVGAGTNVVLVTNGTVVTVNAPAGAGLNGTNGINGTNGLNGVNGTNGLNGVNGTNGVDGVTVEAGTNIVAVTNGGVVTVSANIDTNRFLGTNNGGMLHGPLAWGSGGRLRLPTGATGGDPSQIYYSAADTNNPSMTGGVMVYTPTDDEFFAFTVVQTVDAKVGAGAAGASNAAIAQARADIGNGTNAAAKVATNLVAAVRAEFWQGVTNVTGTNVVIDCALTNWVHWRLAAMTNTTTVLITNQWAGASVSWNIEGNGTGLGVRYVFPAEVTVRWLSPTNLYCTNFIQGAAFFPSTTNAAVAVQGGQ
jgi:hypothetical protein